MPLEQPAGPLQHSVQVIPLKAQRILFANDSLQVLEPFPSKLELACLDALLHLVQQPVV